MFYSNGEQPQDFGRNSSAMEIQVPEGGSAIEPSSDSPLFLLRRRDDGLGFNMK